MSEFLSRKVILPAVVIAALGAGACSGPGEQGPMPSVSPSKPLEKCNGLPPYKTVGRSKDGEPMLQVVPGTTCETGMFDRNTSQNIGASIGPATTFSACVPDHGKPLSFLATISYEDSVGPTGSVNLGYDAMHQWTANQDVPNCVEPEPPTPSLVPTPGDEPSVKA